MRPNGESWRKVQTLFATVILAHLDTQETRQDQVERKDRKFRLVKRLRERGWDQTQVRELFACYSFSFLPSSFLSLSALI